MNEANRSVTVTLVGVQGVGKAGDLNVTIGSIVDYIDASKELDREVKRDIYNWFKTKYEDWTQEVSNPSELIDQIRNELSDMISPETIEFLVNLIQSYF